MSGFVVNPKSLDDIKGILRVIPEGTKLEFKQELPFHNLKKGEIRDPLKDDSWKWGLLEEIAAFSNSDGGTLIVGLEEQKINSQSYAIAIRPLVGVTTIAETVRKQIDSLIKPRLPRGPLCRAIVCDQITDSGILVVMVYPSDRRPHAIDLAKRHSRLDMATMGFFWRRGEDSTAMTPDDVSFVARGIVDRAPWIAAERDAWRDSLTPKNPSARSVTGLFLHAAPSSLYGERRDIPVRSLFFDFESFRGREFCHSDDRTISRGHQWSGAFRVKGWGEEDRYVVRERHDGTLTLRVAQETWPSNNSIAIEVDNIDFSMSVVDALLGRLREISEVTNVSTYEVSLGYRRMSVSGDRPVNLYYGAGRRRQVSADPEVETTEHRYNVDVSPSMQDGKTVETLKRDIRSDLLEMNGVSHFDPSIEM